MTTHPWRLSVLALWAALALGCGTGTVHGAGATGGAGGDSGSTGGDSGSTGGDSGSTGGSTGGLNRNTPLDGLTVDALHFAVTGDCRPSAAVTDPAKAASVYPTAVISRIFQLVAARDPQFAVFTGDVVYVANSPTDPAPGKAQMDLFLQARSVLDRPLASTLGNHDVFGVTLQTYQSEFGVLPYYTFTVHTGQGDAQFVVLNDVGWDSRENDQVTQWMGSSARYHILIKHYPTDTTDLASDKVAAINQILAAHPATLILTGHEHGYAHRRQHELVMGMAGAQLKAGAPGYGYAMVDQLPSGALQVTAYTSASDAQFDQWTVTP